MPRTRVEAFVTTFRLHRREGSTSEAPCPAVTTTAGTVPCLGTSIGDLVVGVVSSRLSHQRPRCIEYRSTFRVVAIVVAVNGLRAPQGPDRLSRPRCPLKFSAFIGQVSRLTELPRTCGNAIKINWQ